MRKKICLFLSFVLLFTFIFSFSVSAATSGNHSGYGGFLESFPIIPNADLYKERCLNLYKYNDNFYELVENGFDALDNSSANYSYDMDYSYLVFVNEVENNDSSVSVIFWDPDFVSLFSGSISSPSSDNNYTADFSLYLNFEDFKINKTTGKPIVPLGRMSFSYNSLKNNVSYNWTGYVQSPASISFYPIDSYKKYDTSYQCYENGWYQRFPIIGWHGENLYFDNLGENIPFVGIFAPDNESNSESIVTQDSYLQGVTDKNTLGLAGYIGSALNRITSKFSGLFNGLKDSILSVGEQIKESIFSVGENIVSSIIKEIADVKEKIDKVSEIFGALHSFGFNENGNFDVITMLQTIFIPDHDYIDAKTEEFYSTNFFWIDSVFNSVSSLFGMLERAILSSSVPEIVIPAGTYGHFVLENDVVWSFSWYLPFKVVADLVIAAFIYLYFFYRLVTSFPNILSGVGSPFVSGAIAFEKTSANKSSANKTFSKRKGG